MILRMAPQLAVSGRTQCRLVHLTRVLLVEVIACSMYLNRDAGQDEEGAERAQLTTARSAAALASF